MQLVSQNSIFNGLQLRYQHQSSSLNCAMHFSVYLPPGVTAQSSDSIPVLFWLSGLTCSDENFVIKAGAQRYAAQHGIAVVCPDTSPRGDGVADDENGAYDFGLGAGFYLNARQTPYASHYHMYDYVLTELPALLTKNLPLDCSRMAISGHSMGGHGALTLALKNPQQYVSVSAFAPICAASQCPWGEKALSLYLGDNQQLWQEFDASALLMKADQQLPMLVDQGGSDEFLQGQLKPELLLAAAQKSAYPLNYRLHAGYDHSYFFIASFIGEHIAFHANHLHKG